MNPDPHIPSFTCETQYLPPVSSFVMMQSFSEIIIDSGENFQKSTWRNRCRIINANGPLLLTVPVTGGRGVRSKTKDVRIKNEERWQHRHWRSMIAAYGKSSYFQFYEEKLRHIYEKQFEFLIDLNTELLKVCFEILHWEKRIQLSGHNNEVQSSSRVPGTNFKPYHQVFEERHGFIADMSIVDLIFNMGNEATGYLVDLK